MAPITQYLSMAMAVLVTTTSAHPGHDITAEIAERGAFIKRSTSLQAKCGKQLEARGYAARAKLRRQALAKSLRERRGLSNQKYLKARDVDDVLNTDHHSNMTGIDFSTDPDTLFGDNSSCLLQEETTEGPYYVSGEYVRPNMTETQQGVPLIIDMQVIDTNTCNPIPSTYVEFWHCNATGVYSGVVASSNGDSSADPGNINATFLRGIQPTDADGVVQISTIVPGHYTGRAPHVHILSHGNGTTVAGNGTLVNSGGASNTHVGQLFIDQALYSAVREVEPYSSNTQTLTTNDEDDILAQEAASTDPMLEYVYVGDSVEEGIVGWITVGVDATASRDVQAAAYLAADGGHANADAGGMGGSGGPPSGSGAPPSGTGMPPSSTATTIATSTTSVDTCS